MADMASVKSTYDHYVVQGASKATALSNKNFAKMCKDCKIVDGKKLTNADVDITFSKHKTKGQQNISFEEFKRVMTDMGNKRFGSGNVDKIFELLQDQAPKATGTTKMSKTGGVEKMTDTSQYTGSHKERFGTDGKGLGLDGREERVENSGYVGNYKGQGSYKGQ